jgi:Uma2 family endonuclease
VITAAPPAPPLDGLTPLRLPPGLRLTPEQFAAVCEANAEAVLEFDATGQIIHITPTGGVSGARNGAQLGWLLIPAEQAVEIWPAQGEPRRIDGATRLDGGELLPGLHLNLTAIWQV